MKIAYFDCFSGASGDMILGAMIDAGLSLRQLREEFKKIAIPDVRLKVSKVLKNGISATQVIVESQKKEKMHRSLKEMLKIVDRSRLEKEVKERSREIFERIASVEAKIHQSQKEDIHFHELGGLDSVVDIVGAVWGLRQLGIEQIHVSKMNVGTGFVKCHHGILPVPAPATLALIEGKPIYSSGVEREVPYPNRGSDFDNLGIPIRPDASDEGREGRTWCRESRFPHPNILRLLIGTSVDHAPKERVTVIETNIDDMNPQFFDYVIENLLKAGALDVFLTPILMKKNRPATLLTVISPLDKLPLVTDFIFRETTTLGLRFHEEERAKTEREIFSIETKYGKVRFKLARWGGKKVNLSPEYEDCKTLALKTKIPLKEIFAEVKKEGTAFLKKVH